MRRCLLPAVLTALLLGGCSTEIPGRASAAATTPTATSTAPTPSSSTATSAPAPTTVTAPAQVLAAGTIADGAGTTVSGTGDALVTYGLGGGFAVVGTLDCSACTGPVQLTAPGRSGSLAEGTAPWTGQGLTGVSDDGSTSGEVVVLAEGPWTLALSSWNDLPLATGPQTGSGSAVLYLDDQVPTFRIDYTPAGPDDSFSARIFSETEGESLVFGDTEAFSESYEVPLPGVLAVQSGGTWTVTPGG